MERRGPWTIVGSEIRYQNQWMKVIHYDVIRPDGQIGIYGVAHIHRGAYVLPLDEEHMVYLTRQFRFPLNCDTVETVSGGIDDGETPLAGAKRELKEELGIEANQWTHLGHMEPLTSPYLGTQHLFLARQLRFGEAHQEGTENISLLKVSLEDAVQMVMESKIIDGPSCTLILKANEYIRGMSAL